MRTAQNWLTMVTPASKNVNRQSQNP